MTIERLSGFVLVLGLLAPPPVLALYKVVGADGKVTYTDRPSTQQATSVVPLVEPSDAASAAALPLALRRTAARFPVTLYVANGCGSTCDAARQFLRQRGIPYSERLVTSRADIEALERLSGGREAPTLTIGAQVLRGYSQPLWQQYLDSAGYPAESRLPAGYQPPAPRPLTERTEIALPAPAAASATPRSADPAPSAPRAGVGGIRF